MVLYDVTTLYFEVQEEELIVVQDFPRNGDWNHRLLLDFWLTVQVPSRNTEFWRKYRGNKTILPVLEEFQKEHHLEKVTVVADAAMLSRTNLEALVANDYHFVVGSPTNKDSL